MSENDFAVVRALFIGNLCIADVDNWCSTEGFDTNELSFEFNPCIAYIIDFCHCNGILYTHS